MAYWIFTIAFAALMGFAMVFAVKICIEEECCCDVLALLYIGYLLCWRAIRGSGVLHRVLHYPLRATEDRRP